MHFPNCQIYFFELAVVCSLIQAPHTCDLFLGVFHVRVLAVGLKTAAPCCSDGPECSAGSLSGYMHIQAWNLKQADSRRSLWSRGKSQKI